MSRARDIADGKFANDLTVDTNTLKVDSTNNKVSVGTGTAVGTLTAQCTAGDSNFALTAYHPTSTSARNIAKFQSNVGSTQADVVTIGCDGGIEAIGAITSAHTVVQESNSIRSVMGNDGGSSVYGTSTNHAVKMFTNNVNVATFLAGGGLTFNGDGAAANALDDYEEGGWVPSATSGITINNVRQATYTKVGRSVSAGFWINADITSTDFVIAGLPYTIFGRFGGSLSNQNLKETLAVTSITTSIYAYGATTGTDDEILFFLTYDT
mgnify:CR=1 FL=1|tara:strand:+ start:257 stop:1057 length:801 start_codon:yes stop_codon:yes gene_type:complete